MKKTNLKKFLLSFGCAFSLIFASCSDINDDTTQIENTGKTDQKFASDELVQIKISLSDSARTVLPVLVEDNYNDFSWYLSYAPATIDSVTGEATLAEDAEYVVLDSWVYDAVSNTAPYTSMTDSTVGVKAGTYSFKLIAKSRYNNGDSTKQAAVYEGITAQTIINGGAQSISFTLYPSELNTDVVVDSAPGNISVSLSYTSNSVSSVEAKMYKYDGETGETKDGASDTVYPLDYNSTKGVYAASRIPAGNYVVVFTLKDSDSNVIGVWEEYVNVIAGLTSEGSVKIESVDDIYTISYVPLPTMKNGETLRRTFSRHSGDVVLPASYQMDETSEAFCGWYDNSAYSGSVVTSFNPTTRAGKGYRKNIKLYGKFIDAKEVALVSTVTAEFTLTGAGGAKTPHVGNIVKAVVKDEENEDVKGTLSYQWYADTSAIAGATSQTYKVTGDEVGKKLKVAVTQAYTVTEVKNSAEKRIYYTAVENSTPVESEETAQIANSALVLDDTVKVQYNGYVIVGNKPNKDSLVISTSTGTLNDEYGNPVRDYEGNFANYTTLTATTSMEVTVTADGYTITDNRSSKSVTIPVQYAMPAESDVKLATETALSELWNGQVIFDLSEDDVDPETHAYTGNWEYATVSSLDSEPTNWSNVTTDAFPERLNGSVATPVAVWVRVKSTGSTTENNLVYASEAVCVEVKDENIAGKVVQTKDVKLLTGPEINAIFTKNFKTATAFQYSSSAPSSIVTTETISVTGDTYTEVKAWVSSRTIYVYAEGYDGTTNKIKLDADSSEMFAGMTKLKTVDLSAFDTSDVKNMSSMFQDCAVLNSITLGSDFTTDKVTDMSNMFNGAGNAVVDWSKFDVSKVTDMSSMFANSAFTELDLSSFETIDSAPEGVTEFEVKMASMFSSAADLESITFGEKFNTSLVKDMSSMFADCASLVSLDLTKATFNTGSAVNMSGMFKGCESLENLKLGTSFTTANVNDMSYMFANVASLADIDVSRFDISNVITFNYMFSGCTSLTKIYAVANADWSSGSASGVGMFAGCNSLIGGTDGISWSSTKISKAYAKVSGGYFTPKSN